MPNSCFRSAASMTKIRKISNTPAATENCAKSRKMVEKLAPDASASSSASCLTGETSSPVPATAGLTSATTASLCSAPATASPWLLISTSLTWWGTPNSSWATASGTTIETGPAGWSPRS